MYPFTSEDSRRSDKILRPSSACAWLSFVTATENDPADGAVLPAFAFKLILTGVCVVYCALSLVNDKFRLSSV
jgi:hypothetical protein